MNSIILTTAFISGAIGALFGYVARHIVARHQRDNVEHEVGEMILNAKKEANKIEEEALTKAKEIRSEIEKSEERIQKQEERIEKREAEFHTDMEALKKNRMELEKFRETVVKKDKELSAAYEQLSGITKEDARNYMLAKITQEYEEDLQSRLLKLSRDGETRFMDKARDVMVNAIYRIANSPISQFMTSTVEIEDEEVKGKIIGKEGRNIKTFERVAGVELLVDENPHGIVISCFDPVRRAIAKNALEALIKDGRINPTKIEETIDKAKKEIGIFMRKKGEEAVLECGILSMPEELIPIIGRLYFRTSYGQNVLDHSIEMAHIAGLIASEIGADVYVAKAGSLLHDIGKAVDHEIQGTHVEIGRKILAKYGVDVRVIQAMQSHHEEYPYETLESVIVQVADAISGGRPGARRDTVDRYIKRLEDLEALAMSFAGIERVYALQAGREIRIFVSPQIVNDLEARDLARNIAIRVEQELRFPGEIKIHVIRESRVIEFAR
jgi:ribonuclease Y